MIWSDEAREIEAPSGRRIAVNTNGEAWCLLDAGAVTLRRTVDVLRQSRTPGRGWPPTLRSWWAHCLDVPDAGDPNEAIRWLEDCLDRPVRDPNHLWSNQVCLLAALRRAGVLLWPAATRWLPHPCHAAPPGAQFYIQGGMTPFEDGLVHGIQQRRVASSLVMACSPMGSVEDLAEEALLVAIEAAGRSSVRPCDAGFDLLTLPRRLEGMAREDRTVVTVVEAGERLLRSLELRGRALPRYCAAEGKPGAAVWVGWFDAMSAAATLKWRASQDSAYGRWLEYLDGLGTVPPPSGIRRDPHIEGPRGFFAWLQGSSRADSTTTYATCVQFLRQLFDVLCDEGEMPANPIRDCDVPPNQSSNAMSDKLDIPRELLDAIVEIVSELSDHAFRQFAALSDGRTWMPAGLPPPNVRREDASLVPPAFLKPALFQRLGVTLRGSDGSIVRVLSPVLPVAVLWLAKVPNRNIEARLADSGEADELLPELAIETHPDGYARVLATSRLNPHPLASRGRRQGAIRIIKEGDQEIVGLYATINKSQRGGHADGADHGWEIPWEDARLQMAIQGTRLWNQAVNPVDRLLSRDQLRQRRMQPSDGLRGKMAGYTYLFRHLRDSKLSGRLEPASYGQLHQFFMCVLDEAEARLTQRRLEVPVGGKAALIPRIVLSRG